MKEKKYYMNTLGGCFTRCWKRRKIWIGSNTCTFCPYRSSIDKNVCTKYKKVLVEKCIYDV